MKTRYIVLAVLLLVLAGAGFVAQRLWREMQVAATVPGPATALQEFDIPQGASLRSVLRLLQEKQLIRNARELEWYLRYVQPQLLAGHGIQAGRYRIVPGSTPTEILQQLVDGRVVMEQVTIVEGWTFAQMRALLAKAPGLRQTIGERSDAALMEELGAPDLAAEGRFAPDTYSYAAGTTSDLQILRMAFEAQKKNLQEAWDARAPDLPLATPDEALALASIVEKETGLASERAQVAGVYINRLRIGMRLQSDPTVIYGIRDHYDGNIRKRDLTTDTAYNTYTRSGLPPTPIALPGREAIVATLHPADTKALYFVATGDGGGGHYFSTTYAEHSRALQRYLERLHLRALADAWQEVNGAPAAADAATRPGAGSPQ